MRKETFPWIEKQTDADKFRTSFLQDGDVVFADTAEDETAGKCCEIRNCESMVIISGLHTIPCRPESKFASGYLGYYLNSTAFHEQLVLKESERPSSLVAQAVSYALNIEEELKKFLKDSRLNIDNNPAERQRLALLSFSTSSARSRMASRASANVVTSGNIIMKIYRKFPQVQALSRLFRVSFVITLRFDP